MSEAGTLEIRLFGGVQLLSSGVPVPVAGARRRTLLALLALRCGEPISTDFLIDALWGATADPAALHNLRANVSNLRKSLGDHAAVLTTRASAYVLDLDPDAVDVLRFERLAANGRAAIRHGEPEAGVAELRRALEVWRGDPLVDLLGADLMDREADRLHHVHLATFEDWIDGALELGSHADVLDDLAPMVEANPLREHLTAAYMRALYRSGRQADALRQYEQTRLQLANELGIDPGPELRELETAILLQDPSLTPSVSNDERALEPRGPAGPAARPQPDGLPADPDDLVGRRALIEDVVEVLDREPLVTLWGPGGVGKTRVAVRVARLRWSAATTGSEPLHFVDLAAVEPTGRVADALLAAIGAQPWADESEVEAAARVLRPSPALVVMDNCEHVLPAVRLLVAALLASCPDLRALLTSRETLGLPNETAIPVAPLETPLDSDRGEVLVGSDAVQLFVARAAAVTRGFAVDDHNASAVSTLVRSLGGLPLAIELAAGRLDVETIEELAADATGGLLARLQAPAGRSDRDGSVASSIAWSYDALSDREQELMRTLSIFAGAFTRDLALEVHGHVDHDTHADFDHLVRSSLVSGDPTVSARFRLLAPVRAFVRDRIGPASPSRAHHAHAMLERTERFAPLVRTDQQVHGCAVFRADFPDVRQAMATLMDSDDGDLDAAARMLVAAFHFCHFQVVPEVNGWAAELAERVPSDHPQAADILGAAALAAWFEGRLDRAIELGEQAVAVAEASGRQAPYWSRLALVDAYGFGGAHERVFPHFAALVRDSRADADPFWRINGMGYEVIGALMMGRSERAERRAGDALQAARDLGNPECMQWALHVYGRAISATDPDAAAAAFEEATAVVATVDSRLGRSLNLSEWVVVKRQAGATADAAAGLIELLGLLRSTGIRSLLSTALRECAYVLFAAGDVDAAAAALLARTDLPDMPVLADDQAELGAALEAAIGDRWARLALQARVRSADAVISLCIDALARVSDGGS